MKKNRCPYENECILSYEKDKCFKNYESCIFYEFYDEKELENYIETEMRDVFIGR